MNTRLLGVVLLVLGATTITPVEAKDLVYSAVEPCRIVDTRKAGGAILANDFRNFRVSGALGELAVQGGTTECLHPKAAIGQVPLAIAVYVLAVPVRGSGPGVLTAYPSDKQPPPAGSGSTVNFGRGQVIGNTTIITLCDPSSGFCPANGEFAILARNTNQHIVVDVQGYFYAHKGLDAISTIIKSTSIGNSTSPFVSTQLTSICPSGSIITGGGVTCNSPRGRSPPNRGFVTINGPGLDPNSYTGRCDVGSGDFVADNLGPSITVYAICLRANVNK